MGKRVAISQSNYIPWKGYFDLINTVDEFVLFDDMQYTRRDWRNRNKIRTPDGTQWLTIPVVVKGKYHQTIRETEVSDPQWGASHWGAIKHNYSRRPFFPAHRALLEELYFGGRETHLSQINFRFLTAMCEVLGITTPMTWSTDYGVIEGKTERLVDLCQKAGGTEYVSGPAAKDYIDPAVFADAGIALEYIDYSGYPTYEQVTEPFDHYVSVVDLILNTGPDAPSYMRSFG